VKNVKVVEVVEVFGREYLRVRADDALQRERLIRIDDIAYNEGKVP
jgi:hypothetical protein